MADAKRRFEAVVERVGKGVAVDLPFDPDEAWGAKPRHPVAGTIDVHRVRAVLDGDDAAARRRLTLGAAWQRDCGLELGAKVTVVLWPEGPQRDDLAPDLAAALDASPAAGAFFDGLAQFYRKGYLTWIDGTKKRPDVRAERIATVVALLEKGVKQRPKT